MRKSTRHVIFLSIVVVSVVCFSSPTSAQTSWSDDFEDGVIDSTFWMWGGHNDRGIGGGSWQFSHEEIIATDGYLKMRVWGPASGGSHGAEAWVRTQYDYNDGLNYVINFRWGADVNASHVDLYAIQVTDGTIPGGTDVFWYGSGAGGIDGIGWKNLYFQSDQSDMPPTDWSIHIDGTNNTATLFDGPNLTGVVIGSKALPTDQPWYVRFIHSDATSSGFPAGDNLLNVYNYCSGLPDIDGDGVPDSVDNCPLIFNPDQADTDNDGVGDVCDLCPGLDDQLDTDGDNVPDCIDNCPFVPNPDQTDCDGDGIGDVCDDDIDGDGVPNASDVCPQTPNCDIMADGRPRLDLNNDCRVDGMDIQLVVTQLMAGCSECN